MTPEQQEREEQLRKLKAELQAATERLPFDIQQAGAVRVEAWKTACDKARKLLNRAPKDLYKYREALRNLQACGGASVTELAEQMYGDEA
jgi:Zn-dependent peptidase ImmA (M78 family)